MQALRNNRGNALILAAVFTFAITVGVVSLMDWATVERKLVKKSEAHTRMVYNTGSLTEFGLGQIAQRLSEASTLDPNEFGKNPLEIPSLGSGFFGDADDAYVTEAELIGGMIPPAVERFIDPEDPKNQNDPDKGETVKVREVVLLSKVVQSVDSSADTSAYSAAIFEIRERPFYTSGVFSDGDLVVLRPSQMDFSGPVHTNGDLVLVSGSGRVNFNGLVTVAGEILTPDAYSNDMYFRSGGTDIAPLFEPYERYNGRNWKRYAEKRWNGYLQTGDMGITRREPFGFERIGINEGEDNPYHKIIEPALKTSDPGAIAETEAEKFAAKAGIVIKIDVVKDDPDYPETYPNQGGVGKYDSPIPDKSVLEDMSPTAYSPPKNLNTMIAMSLQHYYENQDDDGSTVTVKAYHYRPGGDYYRKDADGALRTYDLKEVIIPGLHNASYPADPDTVVRTQGPGPVTRQQYIDYYEYYYQNRPSWNYMSIVNSFMTWPMFEATNYPFLVPEPEPGVATNPAIKMWDARRRKWIHLVDIDIGKLKEIIEQGKVPDWNGIIYIECSDLYRTGVRIVNASEIPNQNGEGLTFATNNALYIKGHFNADGDLSTGSSTEPDSPNEPPAALAADAVTLLSNHWDDRLSRADVTRFAEFPNQNERNKPHDLEVSAAIVSGMGIFHSGGINNFVRFLEMWEGKTVRIRGSQVSLFESEVAWEPWDVQYVYYPPIRDYGYHAYFENKIFPPGTPLMRSFVRKQMQSITESEYNSLKSWLETSHNTPDMDPELYREKIREIQRKELRKKIEKRSKAQSSAEAQSNKDQVSKSSDGIYESTPGQTQQESIDNYFKNQSANK